MQEHLTGTADGVDECLPYRFVAGITYIRDPDVI